MPNIKIWQNIAQNTIVLRLVSKGKVLELLNKKLEKNKVLFKTIEEEKTQIKTKYKIFANSALTKFNIKF